MTDTKTASASGRFVLRIEPELHARLRACAAVAGLSLNEYCAQKLALPALELPEPVAAVLARCQEWYAEELIGVVVFGSWARGEDSTTSDIDVMIVLADNMRIDRTLYRAWDRAPLGWQGRPLEPHFAHLPNLSRRISGFWAEIALDGILLYERDLVVSRRLAAIRRAIVAGRLQQRSVHGQNYWVAA